MNTSTANLSGVLHVLSEEARKLGLSDTKWASLAGLRKETLSRLRRRASCDFVTIAALAQVVGFNVQATPKSQEVTADGHFPASVNREYEQQLLDLCLTRPAEPRHWAVLGPRFFMAGLAVMLASIPQFDRRGLLALAESLHPGSSEPVVFDQWLARSPVKPSRFLPMLDQESGHAT